MVTKAPTETLWQIGKPGGGGREFLQFGTWQAEFTYTVGSDDDPINSPNMPSLLLVPGLKPKPKRGKKQLYATDKLNIRFTLKHNYCKDELTFFYAFYGSETDSLFVDDQKLTELPGSGERKLKQHQIPLPALAQGEHVLTLTTAGGAGDGAHRIDYLKLEGVIVSQTASPSKSPSKTPSQTITQGVDMAPAKKQTTLAIDTTKPPAAQPKTLTTGLEDYAYWWQAVAKGQAEKGKETKEFRRGRIWA